MNKKFPVLSSVSSLVRLLGWLGVVAGIGYATYEGIIEPNLPEHSFGGRDLYELVGGFAFGMLSLIGAAFGELIGVFFAIEQNTRKDVVE